MNNSNFVQTEGYPLTGERLQELQTTFQIFNAFGSLAGNLTIISGCNAVGSTVENGVVFINGELLEFRTAAFSVNSTVIIIEEKVSKPFKNGTSKEVYAIRYATFGTADISWPWSSFKRPIETKEIAGALAAKADKITTDDLDLTKAEQTDLAALQNRVKALESLKIPQIKVDDGSASVFTWQAGDNYNNFQKNYLYVYPPAGYTMDHLAGFMASIKQIKFSGDVNQDDGFWCKWEKDSYKITIICGASEMRESSMVSYLGVWIKY